MADCNIRYKTYGKIGVAIQHWVYGRSTQRGRRGGERALMLTIVNTYCGGTRRVFESRDGAATFRVLV